MEQGPKSFAQRRSLSKRLSQQRYVGKLKGTLKRFLSDRHGRAKDQESSISSNSNTDAMDLSTAGVENTLSSSSSFASQDASPFQPKKKRKSETHKDPFTKKKKMQQNERKADDSSDSSTRSENMRTSGADIDIPPDEEKVPTSPSRKRFDLTKYLPSGRERNSIPTSKRNRLQLFLRQYHHRASSKLEELPSFLHFEQRPSVDSENEFLGRYSNFSNTSESPADLAHAVNLYYRGKDTSPVALADSLRESGKLLSQLSEVSMGSFSKLSHVDLNELANKLPDTSQSRDVHAHDTQGVWSCHKCGWTCRKSDAHAEEQQRHEEHCDGIMKVQQWLGRQESVGEGQPHAPEQDVCVDHQYALENHDNARSSADANALDDLSLQKMLKVADKNSSQWDGGHKRQARGSFGYHAVPNHMESFEIQAKEDPGMENSYNASETKLNANSVDHQVVESHPNSETVPKRPNDHHEMVRPNDSNVIHESSIDISGSAEEISSASSDVKARSKHFIENEGSLSPQLGPTRHSPQVEVGEIACHEGQSFEEQRHGLEKQVNDVRVQGAGPLKETPGAKFTGSNFAETDSNEDISSDGDDSQELRTPVDWHRSEDSITSQQKLHEASSPIPLQASMAPEAMRQHGVAPVCDEVKADGSGKAHADSNKNFVAADGEGVKGKVCDEFKPNGSSRVYADNCESLMAADEDGGGRQVCDEVKANQSSRAHADNSENPMVQDGERVKSETQKNTSVKSGDLANRGMSFTDESREQDQLEVSEWGYPTKFDLSEENADRAFDGPKHNDLQVVDKPFRSWSKRPEPGPGPVITSDVRNVRQDSSDSVNCLSNSPTLWTLQSRTASLPAISGRGRLGENRIKTASSMDSISSAFQDNITAKGASTAVTHDSIQSTGPEDIREGSASESFPYKPENDTVENPHDSTQSTRYVDSHEGSASESSTHQSEDDAVKDPHDATQSTRYEDIRGSSASESDTHQLGDDAVRDPHDPSKSIRHEGIRKGSAFESFAHQSEDDAVKDPHDTTQSTQYEDIRRDGASESFTHKSEDGVVKDPHETTQRTRYEDIREGNASESFTRQSEDDAVKDPHDATQSPRHENIREGGSYESFTHESGDGGVKDPHDTTQTTGYENIPEGSPTESCARQLEANDSRGMESGLKPEQFGEIRVVHEISPAEPKEDESKNCLWLLLEAISTCFVDDTREVQGLRKSLLPNVEASRSNI